MVAKKETIKSSIDYYKQFVYRIEKKISVEDFWIIKDYAKQGLYLYILHDNIDNNRFLFISGKHYEENVRLSPEMFDLKKINSINESIYLEKNKTLFKETYFKLKQGKSDLDLMLKDVITGKSKNKVMFKNYKVHTKKVAIDNPKWYLNIINDCKSKSYKKKALQLLLYKNQYNQEIINHCISTLFILDNPDFQKFNDHSIILDEGRTGKSSLIGYMGEKVDNVSIAGLYGSSDGKNGKFRGGLVTISKKCILIDEMNELIKNANKDKILSVLNSILENGTYNYQKQFSQKIRASNLFFFMGNISDKLNFPLILDGGFGNIETLGRRIGIITYSNNLNGFVKGGIRPEQVDPFLNAIMIYVSKIFNNVLQNPKFLIKLYKHKKYIKMCDRYAKEILEQAKSVEENISLNFLKSHKTAVDRIVIRGLKVWIFNNLDNFLLNNYKYNNHSLNEVLDETEIHLNSNLTNIKNICEHVTEYTIKDKTCETNQARFFELNKSVRNMLKYIHENKKNIDQKGVILSSLPAKKDKIKYALQNYKRHGISQKTSQIYLKFGCNIEVINNDIVARIINKKLLNSMLEGVFKSIGNVKSKDDFDEEMF